MLQVRDGESNSQLAERNRIKTVPVLAPRGKLLDRDGRVIVDNQAAFTLLLTRENLNRIISMESRRDCIWTPTSSGRASSASLRGRSMCR